MAQPLHTATALTPEDILTPHQFRKMIRIYMRKVMYLFVYLHKDYPSIRPSVCAYPLQGYEGAGADPSRH